MSENYWQLPGLTIRSISVSEMDNIVYLITSRRTGAQVLIDAADDEPAIARLLATGASDVPAAAPETDDAGTGAAGTARLGLVVTTHSHWDHVRALAAVAAPAGTLTAAGAEDVADIGVPTDIALHHGDTCGAGDISLEVIGLRGHTPGSVALLLHNPDGPDHLFTGDSLFPGGVGNTQKDPARFTQLLDDVTVRIFNVLSDDTEVHPGHGDGTTLGAERPALPDWRARGW